MHSRKTTAILYLEISLIYLLFKENSFTKSIFMPAFHVLGTTDCLEYCSKQNRLYAHMSRGTRQTKPSKQLEV